MKSITLKVVREEINNQPTVLTTYDLLKTAINNPNQEGFNVEEMMNRLKILTKLEEFKKDFTFSEFNEEILSVEKTLTLEDSEFQKLKSLFKQVKWSIVSNYIVQLNEELEKA